MSRPLRKRRLALASRARYDETRATAQDVRALMLAECCFEQAAELCPDAALKVELQTKEKEVAHERERFCRAMVKRWREEAERARNDVEERAAKLKKDYEKKQESLGVD